MFMFTYSNSCKWHKKQDPNPAEVDQHKGQEGTTTPNLPPEGLGCIILTLYTGERPFPVQILGFFCGPSFCFLGGFDSKTPDLGLFEW